MYSMERYLKNNRMKKSLFYCKNAENISFPYLGCDPKYKDIMRSEKKIIS